MSRCTSAATTPCGSAREALRPLALAPLAWQISHNAGWVVERELFIDNLLVRNPFIIAMIRWTGLAPQEFEFPFPGSLTSTLPQTRAARCATSRPRMRASQGTPPWSASTTPSTSPDQVF